MVSGMNVEWRLLLEAGETGLENMLLDEALAVRVAEGHSLPVIRIYAWPCPAVSLGRHQKPEPLLDVERCEREGIEIVRRPTGGKAILHSAGDITYSVIAPAEEAPFSRDVLGSYAAVNGALVAGLGMLGIRAAVRDPAPIWPETGVGFGCFESPGRHEVYWAGRKLAASAQRRTGGVVLQQGTIPLSETGAGLADLLQLEPGRRERFRRDLNDRAGTLERALDVAPNFREVAHALSEGFRGALGIPLELSEVAGGEGLLMGRMGDGFRLSPE